MSEVKTETGALPIDICVQHGREILASQLPQIKDKGYDFAPPFRQMTIQLYLIGVMWKRGESLNLPIDARDHAFQALQSMLITDGLSKKEAQKRIAFLRSMSKVEGGVDTLAMAVGHEATLNDNSMVSLFEEYRHETKVSGALWRLFERGKKIMFIGGAVAAGVTVWGVTIFLPKTEGIDILAAGLMAAALVVIPTFLAGLLIYKLKIKKSNPSASSPS
jgi:hypothetical protein